MPTIDIEALVETRSNLDSVIELVKQLQRRITDHLDDIGPLTADAQAGEAPTDKMMIEHLNDQIQTLLCENEQLKTAAQVGEQEITGLKAMLVDAGAKIERMKEMLSASERLRDHAERELGKESELVKQLRKDVEINATIEHCAQVAEGFQNKWYDGKEIAAAIRKLKDGV